MASSLTKNRAETTAQNEGSPLGWRQLIVVAGVFLVASTIFFAQLGAYPLFNPDEGLYAEPAREMVDTGEYVTTLLNYVVRFTKPPLLMWMMAASYHAFGQNEFAARFFTAACGALLATVTFLFAGRYACRRAGLFSAAILITSPLFIGVGREAITDMPLSLFIAGSLMSFYHGFSQRLLRFSWLGYVLIALAVMTKGPVGLVLPATILFLFHFFRGDLREAIRFYKPIPGLLVTACIAAPWYVIEIWKTHGAYYEKFIVRENFQRFTSVVDHKAPWWYHMVAIVGGMLPWSIFLPPAAVSVWSLLRAKASTAGGSVLNLYGKWKDSTDREALLLFSTITAITIVGFFSLSVSKLLPYTMPAFPAIAILLAHYFDRAIAEARLKPLGIGVSILLVVYASAYMLLPVFINKVHDCPDGLAGILSSALAMQSFAALLALVAVLRRKGAAAIFLFAGLTFASTTYFGARAIDVLANQWEMPIESFAQFAATSKWPIVVFDMRKPTVAFYTHRHVIIPPDRAGLEHDLNLLNRAYILTLDKNLGALDALGCKSVTQQGKYVLAAWRNPSTIVGDHSGEIVSISANLEPLDK